MRPVVLYRNAQSPQEDQAEREAAEKAGFVLLTNFGQVKPGDLVIGRFSVYPFYKLVYESIVELGGQLLNSIHQNAYICDLENYVADLKELTPETWFTDSNLALMSLPEEEKNKPFVVKGETNSVKFLWNRKMFASNLKEAFDIKYDLQQDSLIGQQKIFFRRYQKLKEFIPSRWNHPPVTEEYRFFVLNQKIVCGGFYWSSFVDELKEEYGITENELSPDNVPREFLEEAIRRIGNKCNFYAIDVARTEDGNWTVIELNLGELAGFSAIDPNEFYPNLFRALKQIYNIHGEYESEKKN